MREQVPSLCLSAPAPQRKGGDLQRFEELYPENQDQILALTVVYVPCSLDSGFPQHCWVCTLSQGG